MNETIINEIEIYQTRGWNFSNRITRILSYAFLLSISGLAIYYVFTETPRYFNFTPQSYGPYWQNRFLLFFHIIGSTIALFTGLIQFISPIRKNYPKFHRILGRIYVIGVLTGSIGSIYLSLNSVIGWMFGTALFTQSIIWIFCTVMAIICIYQRKIEAHQIWMTRSYISTFGFVTFRMVSETSILADVDIDARYAIIAFSGMVQSLFIYEIFRQVKDLVKADK